MRILREDDWGDLLRKERAALHAVESEWLALKSNRAAERYLLFLRHLARVLRKDFNPDQPRDELGRWTDAGGDGAFDGAGLVLAGGPGDASGQAIDILNEDALGGHTYERHVGKSEEYLRARILNERFKGSRISGGLKIAGSSTSLQEANRLVKHTINLNRESVDRFAVEATRGRNATLAINSIFAETTGYEARAIGIEGGSSFRETYGVRVVLRRTNRSAKGYYIHTAYPTNQE